MYSGHDLSSHHDISALWKFYEGRRSVATEPLICQQPIVDARGQYLSRIILALKNSTLILINEFDPGSHTKFGKAGGIVRNYLIPRYLPLPWRRTFFLLLVAYLDPELNRRPSSVTHPKQLRRRECLTCLSQPAS